MAIILERIPTIAALLKEAALSRGTVSIATLRVAYGDVEGPDLDMYATLAAAADTLANPRVAMYSALLATGLMGMPNDNFYLSYRGYRYVEFLEIAPSVTNTGLLTVEQRFRMSESERSRVYRHAELTLTESTRGRDDGLVANQDPAASAK